MQSIFNRLLDATFSRDRAHFVRWEPRTTHPSKTIGAIPDTAVLVCRDCCCGPVRKHTGVDHDDHLERLECAAREVGRACVLVTRYLDACARSNVVVVRARVRGQLRTMWFGEMNSPKRIDALCAWLHAEGLRREAPLPAAIAVATFPPSGESSSCAAQEDRGTR